MVRFWAKSEANLKLKNWMDPGRVACIFFDVNNSVFAVHSNYPFGESILCRFPIGSKYIKDM